LKSIFAVGSEEGEEFASRGRGKAGADADVLKDFRIIVKAEEKGANLFPCGVFVPAKTGDYAVAIALVLGFEHDALVGLVRKIDWLGDDAVESGTFKALEPVGCDASISGGRGDVDGRRGGLEKRLEFGTALLERRGAQVALPDTEEIEEDAGCGGLLGEQLDPGCRGVDAQLEGVEVEMAAVGDDEFAVEGALLGQLAAKRVEHFGEVAVKGFLIAALEEDFVAVAKDEYAEAIPLGLVDPVALGGNGVNAFGEHGEDGRVCGEVHDVVGR